MRRVTRSLVLACAIFVSPRIRPRFKTGTDAFFERGTAESASSSLLPFLAPLRIQVVICQRHFARSYSRCVRSVVHSKKGKVTVARGRAGVRTVAGKKSTGLTCFCTYSVLVGGQSENYGYRSPLPLWEGMNRRRWRWGGASFWRQRAGHHQRDCEISSNSTA